jgi:uncharacterized caspase-like protein
VKECRETTINTWRDPMALKSFVMLCALFSLAVPQEPAQGRAALVIGNSAYKGSPLSNPANDATDIAASLRDADFDVILRTDQDLAGMEQALDDFQSLMAGRDTALFYYAGHGLQVGGENFLVPVREEIRTEAQAKSRSVSLGDLMDRVKASGAKTALVFLDACRDNPFPGSGRSLARGLAVVAAPADVETCVAYATQPGSVANDGMGRNGAFTAAMLRNIGSPGMSLSDLMTSVIADVKSATGGRQVPRVDLGLSRPFFFVDPALAAARSQAALDRSSAELAGLDSRLAELQRQIASASDAQARQRLEVERRRQQALQQAKALEAGSLAREAATRRAKAEVAAKSAAERDAARAAGAKAQAELSSLAAARRAELDTLAKDSATDSPDLLIEAVERLEAALMQMDRQYAAALEKSLKASGSGHGRELAAIKTAKPDMTETDAEFADRQARERADFAARRSAEEDSLRRDFEAQRVAQTAAIRAQHGEALAALQTRVWTAAGRGARLEIGDFDRNARTWSFVVRSADPAIPSMPVNLVARLGAAPDPRAAILALDAAVKADALAAEIDWGIRRDAGNKRYAIELRAVRVRNLTSDGVVAEVRTNRQAAYFVPGKRAKAVPALGYLRVTTALGSGAAKVLIDGAYVGMTPRRIKMNEGTTLLQLLFDNETEAAYSESATIASGKETELHFNRMRNPVAMDGFVAGALYSLDQGSLSMFSVSAGWYGRKTWLTTWLGYSQSRYVDFGLGVGFPIAIEDLGIAVVPMVGVGYIGASQDIPAAYQAELVTQYPYIDNTASGGTFDAVGGVRVIKRFGSFTMGIGVWGRLASTIREWKANPTPGSSSSSSSSSTSTSSSADWVILDPARLPTPSVSIPVISVTASLDFDL